MKTGGVGRASLQSGDKMDRFIKIFKFYEKEIESGKRSYAEIMSRTRDFEIYGWTSSHNFES